MEEGVRNGADTCHGHVPVLTWAGSTRAGEMPPMFEPFAPTIDAFAKRLARNYREVFGRGEPDHVPVLRATAKLALERIAGTDALYHDALHTLFVADVGQAILRGRAMVVPVLPATKLLFTSYQLWNGVADVPCRTVSPVRIFTAWAATCGETTC